MYGTVVLGAPLENRRLYRECKIRVVIVILTASLWCGRALATTPAESGTALPSLISITVETSRAQLTAGSGTGVTAEIRNISTSTVYLTEKSTTLSEPPELDGIVGSPNAYYGFFPTEAHDDAEPIVALQPGDSYQVVWNQKPQESETETNKFLRFESWLRRQIHFLVFSASFS